MKKLSFLFFVCLFMAGCSAEETDAVVFERRDVRLLHQDGTAVVFDAEIADTEAKRGRGLMFRTDIKDNQGMLFLFDTDRQVVMWMANTPISLDMLFIDADGRIDEIVEHTIPFSRDHIPSKHKVRAVFELKAGQASANDIIVGDAVEHPFFKLENREEKR